jgi:hypothetical protein
MALEAVVFSEGLFGCWTMAAPAENVSGGGMDLEGGTTAALMMQGANNAAGTDFVAHHQIAAAAEIPSPLPLPAAARRKRRRTRNAKNRQEVESQRMTHIAVERNRRKQMNEYLAVLRSLMPPSYVQRVGRRR